MKIPVLFFLICAATHLAAQDIVNYNSDLYLKIVTSNNEPVSFTELWLQ